MNITQNGVPVVLNTTVEQQTSRLIHVLGNMNIEKPIQPTFKAAPVKMDPFKGQRLYYPEEICDMVSHQAQLQALKTMISGLLRIAIVAEKTGERVKEDDLLELFNVSFTATGAAIFGLEDDSKHVEKQVAS